MPGIVKAEVPEVEEEAADYGGPEETATGAPMRAMPDYGDLLDDDEPRLVQGDTKESKEEDGAKAEVAPPRKEAIHIGGVQRLTRTHLSELFQSKNLPMFRWVEWIGDDQVICVFEQVADVAVALKGCLAGFQNVEDDRPGPGLWRAQRCMLDFRQANQADRPPSDFKRNHRGGRQVREYRFWEAMKDNDSFILQHEDPQQGVKRPMPSGEDALAAADWDDDAQRRKRLRKGIHPVEAEEEDIDLLNRMAEQDKNILTKEEAGESASLPTTNDGPIIKDEDDSRQHQNKDDADWWAAEGPWQGEESSSWWDGWEGGGGGWWGDEWSSGAPRRRRREWQDQGGKGAGKRRGENSTPAGGAARSRGSAGASDFAVPMDDAEQAKRSRRADRFKSQELASSATRPKLEA